MSASVTPRKPARPRPAGPPGPARPKLKRLRLALILAGLGLLAVISTVFGMMTAVSSDLPALENEAEYRAARNSLLLADNKRREPIAKLTGNNNRILLDEQQISPTLENAVVSIEDRRFYRHGGVDYKGIGRALGQDILRRRAAQGGSTITQQFVKNALSAQGDRSVFQKLREAALAYHLERKWSKEKVLTQYLNSVYFGNGAYGVEAAVRTYFGKRPGPGGDPAAQHVEPAEAALLAGMIASPSMYDPVENPRRARERRNQVLERMLEQGMIGRTEYESALRRALPARSEVHPPRPDSKQPYYSSWLTQQLVDRYRPGVVFGGGLRIKTTLDPELQQAAEQAVSGKLAGVGPNASLVAIENKTGEVKAMVGGEGFDKTPFNLATNGHRQPGSAFKPFTLIAALNKGISPDATFTSKKKVLGSDFVVNNYEDSYAGVASLRSATATSDNSVYAELGLQVGTRRIARLARRMGVRTPISTNKAMTLGGLERGLTPLEMAYAYSTIANRGVRVSGTMAGQPGGPVGVEQVVGDDVEDANKRVRKRIYPAAVGEQARQMLAEVVNGGTGKAASIGEFAAGKTGTTENYGDAWFVGFNDELTVAVWVGYADKLKQMKTEYNGGPVAGGTYPTEIWHDFMTDWIRIRDQRSPKPKEPPPSTVPTTPTPAPGVPAPTAPTTPPVQTAPQPPVPQQPPQQPPPTPQPATPQQPAPTPPVGGGDPGALPARGSYHAAHGRRPGPRDVAAVGVAEAPGQLRRLRDPDPRAFGEPGLRRPRLDLDRAFGQKAAVELQADLQRLRELAGTGAQVLWARQAAPLSHQLESLQRLQCPDEHRGSGSLVLAHGVEQSVDPVRAVHVGHTRLAEQRVGARGEADVGVAGRLGLVVALGLDDSPGRRAVAQDAADEVARHVVHRASEEGGRGHASARAVRARSTCSRTRASDVPPAETLDSSTPLGPTSPARASGSSPGANRSISPGLRSDRPRPLESASRTSPPTMPWASRKGVPRRTSRSATSVAASSSSAAAAAIASRRNSVPATIGAATRRHSSSVSTASNSCSLSSWRSLL